MDKRFSISLNFQKIKKKAEWYITGYQLEMLKWKWLTIPSIGEDMEQVEFLYISDENAKMVYSHFKH